MCDTQSCPNLCNTVDCSPPGYSVHGILQARILEWVTIPFSRGSSWPRIGSQVSHTAEKLFTIWATMEALNPSHGLMQILSDCPDLNFAHHYQGVLVVKNIPTKVWDIREAGLNSGSERSPGEINSNPLQYCLKKNPMDRGNWQVTVHGVAKSQTRLKQCSTHIFSNLRSSYLGLF